MKETNIIRSKQHMKMSISRKVSLWCGIFIISIIAISLINDLLFYDTALNDGTLLLFKKNLSIAEKADLKNGLISFSMRFTYLTVHINVFIGVALINYAVNKKFQIFARRLLNFAITLFIVGVVIYWIFISMELHNRFNKMSDETKKFHEYLHVFVSHGLTLIIGLAGYGFAKQDLVMVKKDVWYSTIYVAFYIICYLIMFSMLFSKAYNGTVGTYEQKMEAGHDATRYLYRFIDPTRPLFMQNPIKDVSNKLLWTKAILLDILLFGTLILSTPLTQFCLQKFLHIKTFANEKEYREFRNNFNKLQKPYLSICEVKKELEEFQYNK